VFSAVGFTWLERFGVAQRCRSYHSSVEGLASVSSVELDLLRACVSAGGERSLGEQPCFKPWALLWRKPLGSLGQPGANQHACSLDGWG